MTSSWVLAISSGVTAAPSSMAVGGEKRPRSRDQSWPAVSVYGAAPATSRRYRASRVAGVVVGSPAPMAKRSKTTSTVSAALLVVMTPALDWVEKNTAAWAAERVTVPGTVT